MNSFFNWLFGKSKEKCENEAEDVYQVKEYEGKIWLIKDGALVCPMEMFKTETIETLSKIRQLYVERNATI